MFRAFLKTAAALGIMSTLPITATANDDCYYEIELNKTKLLYLNSVASAIVVGNPNIADVSVHSSDTLFVVGRGFGETNLLVLDDNGGIVLDANVIVKAPREPGNVRLYVGNNRKSYNCSPYCEASPLLGDESKFLGQNKYSGGTIRNNIAASSNRAPAEESAPPQ